MSPYSDLPAWVWEAPVDGHPRLFLSTPSIPLWRWAYFLTLCHPDDALTGDTATSAGALRMWRVCRDDERAP